MDNATSLADLISQLDQGVHSIEWQGFPLRIVRQAWGDLAISLYGAQVLWFQPAGQYPVLWTTTKPAPFPKAVRGGVPLCWPWFAEPLEENAGEPFHGVARTVEWEVNSESYNAHGGEWLLKPVGPIWTNLDPAFSIKVVDSAVTFKLTTHNVGEADVRVTQALHSYLAISSRASISVSGLDGADYADKNHDFSVFTQSGDITVNEAIDRIYHSTADVYLKDVEWQRVLKISKKNSQSTVVWNAGADAEAVPDIGLDQVDSYLCIEAAKTRQYDGMVLAPQGKVSLETTISVAPLAV